LGAFHAHIVGPWPWSAVYCRFLVEFLADSASL
jgi:hypothetical protein